MGRERLVQKGNILLPADNQPVSRYEVYGHRKWFERKKCIVLDVTVGEVLLIEADRVTRVTVHKDL